MDGILKNGLRLFVKIVISNVLSAIVVLSVVAFSMAAFADEIGYDAYGVKGENQQTDFLYRYNKADGTDTRLKEFEAQGYTVTKRIIRKTDPLEHNITMLVAQFFALGLTITYIYPAMWDRGYRDSSFVSAENLKNDRFRGLKIGLAGAVPSYLLLLIFLVFGKLPTALFKLLNSSVYTFLEFAFGKSTVFSQLNAIQIIITALIFLIIPLIAWGAYTLGFKDVAIMEKLTYKKKDGEV